MRRTHPALAEGPVLPQAPEEVVGVLSEASRLCREIPLGGEAPSS
jgi:hypothetical protein